MNLYINQPIIDTYNQYLEAPVILSVVMDLAYVPT